MTRFFAKIFKPGMFRLFLSALVVLFHATKYFPFGEFAVNTFFILSGYWIYRMYDTHYQYLKNPFKTFIISRILRIYPLYYFCTLAALSLIIINPLILKHHIMDFLNLEQLVAIAGLISYNQLDEKLLPPAWSLAIEIQYYILAPFAIILLKEINIKLISIFVFAISLFGMISSNQIINNSVIPYLAYFLSGMLIWHCKPLVNTKTLNINIWLTLVIVAAHYCIPFLQRAIFERDVWFGNVNYLDVFSRTLPLLCIPMIIFSLNLKSDTKDRRLGDLSYTIYLFHWIPFSIYNYFFATKQFSIRFPAFLLYLVVLSISCLGVYFLFEKKIESIRKSILR